MKSPIPASLSLLLLTLLTAGAQTADDFFHGGAQRYLTNNVPGALEVVTNGLQHFPDDGKLKKLYELLNQKQQQQQDQQDQKQQEQDRKDEQKQNQKPDQQKQDEQKDQQQSKDDKQKQQEARDKKSQDKKSKQPAKPDEKKESGEPQQIAAHAMTPQEAKQLLDAQKGDEQVLQFQPQSEPKNRQRLLKDW